MDRQIRPELLLRTSEAAERIGISVWTLRDWTDEGYVPRYLSPKGQRRYKASEIDEFMEKMREAA